LSVAGWTLTDAGWERHGKIIGLGPDIPHGFDSVDEGVEHICYHYYLVNAVGKRLESIGLATRRYTDAMNAVESALTSAINQANFDDGEDHSRDVELSEAEVDINPLAAMTKDVMGYIYCGKKAHDAVIALSDIIEAEIK